jgi:hypothetical protein
MSFAWAPCALHLCFNMAAWAQGDLMTHSLSDVGVDLYPVLVESYTVNERMNQIVLEHLDPAAWRLKLPGSRGTDYRRYHRARPQHPPQVAKALSPSSEAPSAARPG